MNNLPEPVLDNIFKYKHQLEFRHVMDELTGNLENMYFNTKLELLRWLIRDRGEIDCIVLSSNRRISVDKYIAGLRKLIFN
jgi:hypothetical protein